MTKKPKIKLQVKGDGRWLISQISIDGIETWTGTARIAMLL